MDPHLEEGTHILAAKGLIVVAEPVVHKNNVLPAISLLSSYSIHNVASSVETSFSIDGGNLQDRIHPRPSS